MQDEEIRLACITAAISWSGNQNKMDAAKEFYGWVTEGPRARLSPSQVEEVLSLTAKTQKGSKQK